MMSAKLSVDCSVRRNPSAAGVPVNVWMEAKRMHKLLESSVLLLHGIGGDEAEPLPVWKATDGSSGWGQSS